jgi:Transcriptional regulator, AbiEi antitoxin
MTEVCGSAPTPRARIHSVRVARLAERQGGVAGRAQLLRCGLSGTVLSRWVAEGRLHRVHPLRKALSLHCPELAQTRSHSRSAS